MGYPHSKKTWNLYDLEKQVFFLCRDVTFHEDIFLFAEDDNSSNVGDVTHFIEPLVFVRKEVSVSARYCASCGLKTVKQILLKAPTT